MSGIFGEKFTKGFSMMEVIMGIFVLTVGLVGIMLAISGSLKNSIDSRNQTIATELAQEGLELVRNIRDNNIVKGEPAFDGGTEKIITGGIQCWRVSAQWATATKESYLREYACSNNTDPFPYTIRYDKNNHWYDYVVSNELTRFARRIKIEGIGTTRTITSIVSWKGHNVFPPEPASCNLATQCVFMQDTLADW